MDGNEIRSAQYTAHCRRCFLMRSLTREQVLTGHNPVCEGCGDAMVVYLSGGARTRPAPLPAQEQKTK